MKLGEEIIDTRRAANLPLFTQSFNRQASTLTPARQAVVAKSRLRKVKQLTRKSFPLGGGRTAVRRLQVQLHFCTGLSRLLGKNAYAILERRYRRLAKKPTWCIDKGSVMGPGALAGRNALSARWLTAGTAGTTIFSLSGESLGNRGGSAV